jgi:hypothetical protein
MNVKLWTRLSVMIGAGAVLLFAAVHTDYNHSTNFGNYKTYSWIKVEAGNSLWQDRIQHAVDSELAAKGWQLTPSGGDAALAAIGSVKVQQQLDTYYTGLGGGWFWRGFGDGVATTTVENVRVGDLMVDIFDAKTKKLIWRGSAEKALSGDPEKNEKKMQDEVKDMFKKFPPASKG